ncbi:MAG: hypothetical protein AAF916_01230 [Planctomycetota bacterium]
MLVAFDQDEFLTTPAEPGSISGDGTTVVGSQLWRRSDGRLLRSALYIDVESGAAKHIFGTSPRVASYATNVSFDGSIIVGHLHSSGEGFVYDRSDDTVAHLGRLPGGDDSSAPTDISDDGRYVIGSGDSSNASPPWRREAYLYDRQTDEFRLLGDLEGGNYWSAANAISGDGSTIVGNSMTADANEAFHYDINTHVMSSISTGETTVPEDISHDGSVVVGYKLFDPGEGPSEGEAYIWDAEHGMQSIRDLLDAEGQGEVISGWDLARATGVSADGTTIVGWGRNPQGEQEGWVVSLRESLPTIGDFSFGGVVEQSDLNLVLDFWGLDTDLHGPPEGWNNTADLNGRVDQEELNLVLNNWGSSAAPSFEGFDIPEPASALLLGLCALVRRRP